MQNLEVLLVQSELAWEQPSKNLDNFAMLLAGKTADLIVLPEMFTTGFSMNPKPFAEPMNGETVSWMKHLAARTKAVVTGSVMISDGGKFFNRLLWVTPTGEVLFYDKRHLFGLLGEQDVYTAGSARKVFNLGPWRVCPQICYDLRFPVWCRNQNDYDVLLFVANWPRIRAVAWNALLQTRAIENQCYVIGVNRVGTDGNGLEFGGESQVIDALGTRIIHLDNSPNIAAITLKREELEGIRAKLPFLKDRDNFDIRI